MRAYTAVLGGYDHWVESERGDYRFVVVTDNESLTVKWSEKKVIRRSLDPRLVARWVKILPETLLGSAAPSLWIDGSMTITDPGAMLEDIGRIRKDLAAPVHRMRSCVYQEAGECNALRLDDEDVIGRQMARYQAAGYPPGAGLHETGILYRRPSEPVRRFGETWWREVMTGSVRDQLSFDYCLWLLGLWHEPLPAIDSAPWVTRRKHLGRRGIAQ